ncbi:hypothetical protein [Pseudomonas donghuensis]|uniref:Uncharacterized protein n=1 Tax=Pseudomonas donghuensis TaxID=1163398 RepID=A0AAP0SF97_9PSED|nr:hypothetical protein [Pseudomonas donghuensis]KDN98905.1 hypothetical protein BV82_3065 [Pseudomonas donghuensis]MCP6691366.1 hypothetical protein [Pseudomonas donghuensis]
MSEDPKFSPYERHDAAILGLAHVVKILAAAVYVDSPHKHFIDEELKAAMADEKPAGVPPSKLELYRSTFSGVIKAINSVK